MQHSSPRGPESGFAGKGAFSGGGFVGYAAIGHAVCLGILLSWWFGGMEATARTVTGWLCAPAPVITLLALRAADRELRYRFSLIAVPLALIAACVGISALNPYMQLVYAEGEPSGLMPRDGYLRFLPSTAWPGHSLRDFAYNAGLVLVALNVFLARPARSLQTTALGIIAANAGLLACTGTIFKLQNADRMLDITASPNPHFFATFVYHNHWGAFALLGMTAAASIGLYYWRRTGADTWRHTPGPLFGLLALLIAATLPLSGARASLGAGILLMMVIAARSVSPRAGGRRRRRLAPVAVVAAALLMGLITHWLAQDRVSALITKTSTQIREVSSGGIGDARLPVYRTTWDLFQQRPVFGWGWQSFRYIFRQVQPDDYKLQNEQRTASVVLDAHNDWLQRLMELGLVGAVLSLATLIAIARITLRHYWLMTPSFEILVGLGCLALIALVDFPFACPAVVITAWTELALAAGIAYDRDLIGRG